ncbi:FG-GAP repeat domain-containing protein [Desulfomarina sp.]
MKYITVPLIMLVACLGLAGPLYGKSESVAGKIIFTGFDVESAGSYKYLQNGIQSMLLSRLAAKDGFEILDKQVSSTEIKKLKSSAGNIESVSSGLQADFLVAGSLFSLSKGLNIQVIFYPIGSSSAKDIERFSVVSESDSVLFARIDHLVEEIAVRILGNEPSLENTEGGGEGKIAEKGAGAFITAHPEIAYKRGLYSGTVIGVGDRSIKVATKGIRWTKEFSSEIIAMAVAEGNGSENIFILSERKLKVYRLRGRKIVETGSTDLPPFLRVHAMNIADLDNDGVQEIYLSATRGLNVSSRILLWREKTGFETLYSNIPWYIRPVKHPEKGWILAGQRRGMERAELVEKGVFRLLFTGDKTFKKGEELILPEHVNLFDFTYADIDGDTVFETAVIDQNEKLRVYDSSGGLLWVSRENYGGSKTYIGPSVGSANDHNSKTNFSENEDGNRQLVFVPGKIVAVDVVERGRQDLVVVNNIVSSFPFFKNLRMYDGGSVVGLTWNGEAFKETWRTGKHAGFISGFDFKLKDNQQKGQGVATLYVGQIPRAGTFEALIPGGVRSKLSVYELGFSIKKQTIGRE